MAVFKPGIGATFAGTVTVTTGGLTVSSGTSALQAVTATTYTGSDSIATTKTTNATFAGLTVTNPDNTNSTSRASASVVSGTVQSQWLTLSTLYSQIGTQSNHPFKLYANSVIGLTINTDASCTFASTATATAFRVGSNQVVGARDTGWSAMTDGAATFDRATVFDTNTITLKQLAGRFGLLQQILTTHGLIGA
jgi:hypothetical protein